MARINPQAGKVIMTVFFVYLFNFSPEDGRLVIESSAKVLLVQ